MTRAVAFLLCLAAATALLLWQAGGIDGPHANRDEPEVGTARPAPSGSPLPLTSLQPGQPQVRVQDIGQAYYPRTEPRTVRDARTGESVEIPHFVAWTFEARSGLPVPGREAPEGAIVFEDVVVRAYREPGTADEARRLRDDPRSIDAFARLRLYARHARADGIASLLRTRAGPTAGAPPDWTIRLEGDVQIDDLAEHVTMRGPALTFDPEAGRAEGAGPFTVEHPAWKIEGEALTIVRDAARREVYRVDLGRHVFVDLQEDPNAARRSRGPGGFRPTRATARRAALLHDAADGERVHVALEGDVRALQRGGRRLLADRLRLTAQAAPAPRGAPRGAWSLVDFSAEGAPAAIEFEDEVARAGGSAEGRLTARSVRYERSPSGAETTTLDGEPVVVLSGDLSLPGLGGRGRWMRARARDRAVLADADGVAHADDGARVAGQRLALHGDARLERRGDGAAPFEDVLEGDEVTLTLRPGDKPGQAQPVAFAALGHVRLAGTRVHGETQTLRVDGLDTLTPSIATDGVGTRLAFVGFTRGERLLGADPADPAAPAAGPAGPGPDDGEDAWALDRLEATGNVAAETELGGPTVGVPTWLEAQRATYERVAGRAVLTGSTAAPASVRMDAGGEQRHALTAPTLTFERARGRVKAEGGVEGEVHLGPGGTDGAPAGFARGAPGSPAALALTTDGPIEVRFRLRAVGGDLAPGAPQVLRVVAPSEAEMRTADPGVRDRLRSDRLDVVFVTEANDAPAMGSGVAARAAREPRPTPTAPRSPPTPSERWRLAARTLTLELAAGRLETLEAEDGVVVDGETLHAEGRSLRFDRATGTLGLEGTSPQPRAVPRTRVRFGAAGAASTVEASALRVGLDADGPRTVQATGPVQALLLERGPKGWKRYEMDCRGDVRITRTELATQGAAETWLRSTERPGESGDWGAATEVWTQRLVATGHGLLAPSGRGPSGRTGGAGGAAPALRRIERVLAEGPSTALASGLGATRLEVWCQRIEIAVADDTAALSGTPGHDVRLRRGGQVESEMKRAVFDLRSGAVHDVEAGSVVLRQGR